MTFCYIVSSFESKVTYTFKAESSQPKTSIADPISERKEDEGDSDPEIRKLEGEKFKIRFLALTRAQGMRVSVHNFSYSI